MDKNNVFLNDDNIIEITVVGDQDEQSITAMGNEIKRLIGILQAQNQPVRILDDVLQIKTVTREGRNLVVELGKTLPYDRLVILGRPGIMRFGTNLMLRAMNKSDKMRFFDQRSQAEAWLKEA